MEFTLKAKVFIMLKGLARPFLLYLHGEKNTDKCFIPLSRHPHNGFVDTGLERERQLKTRERAEWCLDVCELLAVSEAVSVAIQWNSKWVCQVISHGSSSKLYHSIKTPECSLSLYKRDELGLYLNNPVLLSDFDLSSGRKIRPYGIF